MSWSKTIKNAILGAPPKKEKKALKPAHAKSTAAAKRVRLADVLKTPPTSRLVLVGLAIALGLVLWLVPEVLSLGMYSATRLTSDVRGRLERGARVENGFASHVRRAPREADELASLYGALATHQVSAEHEAVALRRLEARETLWEIAAACGQLAEASESHHSVCRERLAPFASTGVFSDLEREPQLRSAALATHVYHKVGGDMSTVSEATVKWLLEALLNEDGGFGGVKGLPSSMMDTWRAVRLLRLLNALDSEVARETARFVYACQAVDGGYSQRPQRLLERASRHAPSDTLVTIRGAHTALMLNVNAKAALRYLMASPPFRSTSALSHYLFLLTENAPSSLPLSVVSPGLASWFRSAALVSALLGAPFLYVNVAVPGEMALLAGCAILAGASFEAGLAPVAVLFTAVALLLAFHLLAVQIPFNDTGEEMLYVSIASALGSFGLFYALGYSGVDVFTTLPSLYVFLVWSPLCTYLAVYVACMIMVRPNKYFVASAYGAWLLVLGLVPFLLYRRGVLETVIRLLLVKGHFAPAVATSAAISLFFNHAAAMIANSI